MGCGVAIFLHLRAGHSFPVPWPDEIDFLTPASQLAHHGTLRVPQLSSPDGMFWISDAYYLLLAPILRFAPATIDTGRWLSLVGILIAGWGFAVAAWRMNAPRIAAAAMVVAWLASPGVVIAGNITRHEAIVLALVAWALVATISGRRVIAFTLAGWAFALHPAAAAFAVLLVMANLRRGQHRTQPWEWAVGATLVAFVAFEIVHIAPHFDLAFEQLRFQANRKAARRMNVPPPILAALVLLLGATLVHLRVDPRRHLVLAASVGVAGWATNQVGAEMWYQVYGNETAALLLGLGFLGLIAMVPVRRRLALATTATVALGSVLFGSSAYTTGFYGMRFGTDTGEWDGFVVEVRGQLNALSGSTTVPSTVAISALSGLPWPAETDRIGNLQLVKETPVTEAIKPDYVLFARTVCCGAKPPIPAGEVVATISSPTGAFDATLLKLAR